MKYSEFKQGVETLGLSLLKDGRNIYVQNDSEQETILRIIDDGLALTDYENIYTWNLETDKRLKLQKLVYKYSRTPIDERHDIKYGFKLDNGSYLISNDVKTVAGNGWSAPSAVLSEYCVSTSEQYPFETRAEVEKTSKPFKGQIVSEDND